MARWLDPLTGVTYEVDDLGGVRRHVAGLLVRALTVKGGPLDAKAAADVVARFWKTYYRLIFPLRVGARVESGGGLDGEALFPGGAGVIFLDGASRGWRSFPLEPGCRPPIVPYRDGDSVLLADHLLSFGALVNVGLRRRGLDRQDAGLFHQVRLAALLHELIDEVCAIYNEFHNNFPQAVQVSRFLNGVSGDLPEGLDGSWLRALHEGQTDDLTDSLTVAMVAVQRIKQYVFETPGLSEIRGASTLIDVVAQEVGDAVAADGGPEVVLRVAGATVVALFPDEEAAREWVRRARQAFYRRTGTAFIATGLVSVSVGQVMGDFRDVMHRLAYAVEADRFHEDRPVTELLPFEERCRLCGHRAAEGWTGLPAGEVVPACRPCGTKRSVGRAERKRKIQDLMEEYVFPLLGGDGPKERRLLEVLQVRAEGLEAAIPDTIGPDAEGRPGLIHPGARRQLVGVIYGDGNRFGAVVQNLSDLSMSLQWTHRVEAVTRAFGTLGMVYATRRVAEIWGPLERLPFQVLALGGDDCSFLAWAPCAMWWAQRWVQWTDEEFRMGDRARARLESPVSFSIGVLVVDGKAPVRRAVEFTEHEVLKWAKRAARYQDRGQVAWVMALTADQIPTDLEAYRETMWIRRGGRIELALTLRPFAAAELAFLLEKAEALRSFSGPLHRLAEAFVRLRPMAACLHYLYQKARHVRRADNFFSTLEAGDWRQVFSGSGYPDESVLPARPLRRSRFEEGSPEKPEWFSPVGDLLELVKILE